MDLSPDQGHQKRAGVPVAIFVALGLAVVGILVGWLLTRGGPPQQAAPVLTPEAKAYVREGHLALSDVNMSASENFAKQTLVEITGKITNTGSRPVKTVDLTCVFYDPYSRVVMRERVPIVSARMGGLLPGQTKTFRLPFDTIPDTWNRVLPDLVIAQIIFD